ncbi:GGDEF domain-containing protein [Pacificibacter marinus]|uniref:diguanylate cyclase n=1 Tax=Pacificibacter marinus TaxID=658057 RepID=A0A1Y5RUJ3_9RHOB|nr:diguanylate cyclase [Pacificibacter marinus]SEL32307.1 diguanylate cyclase (GGDEF) domain-containing protein [Pacificibacter marinus]SLN22928.1 putative diguanylate cyclase YdaM [Pacificibacter marinus]
MSGKLKRYCAPDHAGTVGFGPALAALQCQKMLTYIGITSAISVVISILFAQNFLPTSTVVLFPHGLTLTCLLLLACTAFAKPKLLRLSIFGLCILLAGLRWIEILAWPDIPFSLFLEQKMKAVMPSETAMGANTAMSVVFISIGAVLRHRSPTFAFVLLLAGLAFPSISAIGYTYGHHGLYGVMSPATTIVLIALGGAEVLNFVRSPLLLPLLTTSSWARMARLQLVCVVIGAWVIGVFLNHSGSGATSEAVVGWVIWLFLGTMLVAGARFERIDRERRAFERELERRANFDPLTGLWNRRAVRDLPWFNAVKRADQRVEKDDHVGVILADVDMFKRINDISGHEQGDRVLRDISRVLRERVRGVDVVARWGGEEFLVLLPNITVEKTMEMAQILRVAVATSVSWSNAGQSEPVTLSMGVTVTNENAEKTLESAIQNADTALYSAKSQGRNQVMLFGDQPSRPKEDLVVKFASNRAIH